MKKKVGGGVGRNGEGEREGTFNQTTKPQLYEGKAIHQQIYSFTFHSFSLFKFFSHNRLTQEHFLEGRKLVLF